MRFRRILSAVGPTLRVISLSVCILVGVVLVALHTAFVREWALDWAEEKLEEDLAGEVDLGTLRGILLHRITLSGIEVRDAAGDPVLEVGSITIELDPRALLFDGEVRIEEARIDRPVVTIREAPVFEVDTATRTEGKPGGFLPIPVVVESLRLVDGRFEHRATGQQVENVDLVASGRIGWTQISAEVERLAFTPTAYASRLELFATGLVITGDRVRADKVRFADAYGSHGFLASPSVGFDDLSVSADYLLSVTGESAGRVLSDPRLIGRLRLEGTLGHGGAAAPWTLAGEGELATAPLTVSATAGPSFGDVAATLEIEALDPVRVHPAAPHGPIGGTVEARLSRFDWERLTGSLEAHLRGRFRYGSDLPEVRVRSASIESSADEGRVRVYAALDSPIAELRLHARGHTTKGGFELISTDLTGDVEDISAVVPPSVPVAGALHVDATVRGPLSSPSGRATLRADRARIGSLRVARLEAQVDRDAPGPFHLRLTGRDVGEVRRFALSGEARLRGEALSLEVSRLTSNLAGRDWEARGRPVLVFEPGARLEVRDLGLVGGDSRLRASFVLDLAADRILSANLEVPNLALDVVRSFANDSVPEAPEGGLSAVATVKGRDVRAEVSVFGDRIGHGEVALRLRAPSRSLSPGAWRARGRSSLLEASSKGARLDLGNLLQALGAEAAMGGVLSWALDAGRAGRPLDGLLLLEEGRWKGLAGRADLRASVQERGGALTLKVTGTAVPPAGSVSPEIDLLASGRLANGRLSVEGTLDGRDAGRLTLRGVIDGPADAFAPATWARLRFDDIATASVTVAAADLERWGARIGAKGLGGLLTGSVLVRDGGRLVQADAKLREVEIPDLSRSLDGEIFLSSRGRWTKVHAGIFDEGWPVLTATVAAHRSLRALARGSASELARVPVQGRVDATDIPLHALATLFDTGDDVAGSVSLEGALAGSWSKPRFDLTATSNDARVRGSTFDVFEAQLGLTRTRLSGRANMKQRRGGKLQAEATVGLEDDQTLSIDLAATRFDLRFLSLFVGRGPIGGVGGRMDANMSVSGRRTDPRLDGNVVIDDLRAILVHPIPPIERTHAELRVEGEKVVLRAEGESGDGTFTLEGDGHLPDFTEPRLTGSFRAEDVAVAIGPRLAKVDLEADWNVESTEQGVDLGITVTDGDARLPNAAAEERLPIETFDRVTVVDALGEKASFAEKKPKKRSPSAFRYRVDVQTDGAVEVRSSDLEANVTTNLTLESSPQGLLGRGIVSVTDGTIDLFGRRWSVNRATLRLPGDPEKEPRIDISLQHDFTDVVVFVNVTGTPSDPKLEFTSEPPGYTRDQLLGFVLGGSPRGASQDSTLAGQAASVAAGFLMGKIQSRLEDKLPIDTLSVALDDEAAASGITLGKWITDRIFLSYNYAIQAEEDENRNEATVRVLFGRGWMVEASYGDRGVGGADVLWIRRF